MKSTKIHVKNVPETKDKKKYIHLKPIGALIFIVCMGVGMLFYNRPSMIFGIWLILLGMVGLVMMPDRLLFFYCNEFLILPDGHDQNVCFLLYWSEITSWHYVRSKSYDQLIVQMEDGTSYTADAYSHRRVEKIMNAYIPGKEIKSSRIGKGNK